MRLTGIFFTVATIWLTACETKQDKNTMKPEKDNSHLVIGTTGAFGINSYLDSVAHAFIQHTNCKNCIYEMYFDKQDDTESKVTLHCITAYPDYIRQNKPILYLNVDSIRFYVYTGMEDFVVLHNSNDTINVAQIAEPLVEHSWAIVKTKDSTFIVPDAWPPFINIPLKPSIKFKAPVGVK